MPPAKRERNVKPWIHIHNGNNQGWQKLDGSGLETKWGRDFKAPVQRGPKNLLIPLYNWYWIPFPGSKGP